MCSSRTPESVQRNKNQVSRMCAESRGISFTRRIPLFVIDTNYRKSYKFRSHVYFRRGDRDLRGVYLVAVKSLRNLCMRVFVFVAKFENENPVDKL